MCAPRVLWTALAVALALTLIAAAAAIGIVHLQTPEPAVLYDGVSSAPVALCWAGAARIWEYLSTHLS